MEFNQTVMARRSLRAYEEGKTVEKAQIEELIRFAQMAPSWKNSQTARYYIVSGPKTLQAVKSALPEFNQKNVENVPVRVSLKEQRTVGIVGEKADVFYQLRSMLVELATMHSFRDVHIIGLFEEDSMKTWGLIRWLPHIWMRAAGALHRI